MEIETPGRGLTSTLPYDRNITPNLSVQTHEQVRYRN